MNAHPYLLRLAAGLALLLPAACTSLPRQHRT